ncbi:hypothetical protein AAL_06348 [Moelleriella libera RCEF 2490]|uniref:Uncharacterized protein n=1 Tax=Moelleriella libera RCEF 2490 TaxID=1081109 RepID=A0A167Z431_9HYPO|nr:hypothetical protein AAL_06348 [Moelleriella libera RCEF 2490]
MGQNLFDKIQARLELLRLEKRYTRRRNRRSTFQSNAIYVDGEYVFQTPSSTGSSTNSNNSSRNDALHGEMASTADQKNPVTSFSTEIAASSSGSRGGEARLQHFASTMPSFGNTLGSSNSKGRPRVAERQAPMIR